MRALVVIACLLAPVLQPVCAAELHGTVVDAATGAPLPARVYVQAADGTWLFVRSASPEGSALPYREQWVPMPQSVEKHTTISAHPFSIDLAPGRYEVTIERGKEYFPLTRTVTIGTDAKRERFALTRWVNMADRGWYSGETHVHRRIRELPNALLAEDLNVAFPVTFWTTKAFSPPTTEPSPLRRQGPSPFGPREDRGSAMCTVDATHVFFPRNTEYEIFSVNDRAHVLGVISLLNHRSRFTEGIPPVAAIAEQAHREGAIIDLEKHNWPCSLMLVPVARVDLYELANNSLWKTAFGFRTSMVPPAAYMQVETDEGGFTEQGWIDFGLETYYTLQNCGFRLAPTAGTASGVHPVPLGFGRVYVHLEDGFSGPAWIAGLRRGRSFVTTGPMLFATIRGKDPGHVFRQEEPAASYTLRGEVVSAGPISRLEVVVNGRVTPLPHVDQRTDRGAFASRFERTLSSVRETSWIAVRVFMLENGRRVRFAHTAPWYVEVGGQPIRPRREETDYLIGRIREELRRNQGILPEAALAEYRKALRIYQDIARRARD
jgi:hypothetical protein